MESGFDVFKVARKRDFAARAVTKILAEHESDTAPLFLWVELQGQRKTERDQEVVNAVEQSIENLLCE